MAKEIKEIHPEDIALIKSGNFYKVYGKDAYIISKLFQYTIKEEQGVATCGFPVSSVNKVQAKLEDKKVNYMILDKRDNYSVDDKIEFKNLNAYQKEYEASKTYVKNSIRIENIYNYLQKNVNNENLKNVLKELENIIKCKS